MKIALVAAGGLGDTLPFLRLGQGLLAAGHQVTLSAASFLSNALASQGVPLTPYDQDLSLIKAPELLGGWHGDDERTHIDVLKSWTHSTVEAALPSLLTACRHNDGLVVGPMLFLPAITLGPHLRTPLAMLQHTPSAPTPRGDSHYLRTESSVSWLRSFAGTPRLLGWLDALQPGARLAAESIGVRPPRVLTEALRYQRLPAFTAVSRVVAPAFRPDHRLTPTTGFLLPAASAPLDDEIQAFLDAGAPPVYVGLGSVTSKQSSERLTAIVDAVVAARGRAIVPTDAGLDADRYPANRVYQAGFEPFDRLFPRCSLVIHHGGAGTTAHALVAGTPQLVTPLTADQAYFGRRSFELGVATRPVHLQHVSAGHVHEALGFAARPWIREHAAEIGRRVQAEDSVGNAVRFLERVLR